MASIFERERFWFDLQTGVILFPSEASRCTLLKTLIEQVWALLITLIFEVSEVNNETVPPVIFPSVVCRRLTAPRIDDPTLICCLKSFIAFLLHTFRTACFAVIAADGRVVMTFLIIVINFSGRRSADCIGLRSWHTHLLKSHLSRAEWARRGFKLLNPNKQTVTECQCHQAATSFFQRDREWKSLQ